MAKSKRVNPCRQPVTRADLEKAKSAASGFAVETALTMVFTALLDRCGMSVEEIRRIYDETNNVADSLEKGYVTLAELKWTLRNETGIVFKS